MRNHLLVCGGILCMAAITAGCGLGGRKASGTYQDDSDYLLTVGFCTGGEDSEWKSANIESVKATLTEANGYELLWEDAMLDQEAQVEAIRDFISRGADYIVLDPVVETGWDTVLKEAKEASVPVIVSNRRLEVEEESLYECWLGGNFRQQGKQAGEWLENYFTEDEAGKETDRQIAILQGTIGDYMQMERTSGFVSVAGEHADWILAAQQTAEGRRETASEITRMFLEENAEIDVILAESPQMALGAADGVAAAGRSCGPGKEIAIVSFGAGSEILDAMEEGTINAAIENNPLCGPRIAEIIRRLEAGVAVDSEQFLEGEVIDAGADLQDKLEETKK